MLGFIDDDPEKDGRRFQGYTILGGREELMKLIANEAVDVVIISIRAIDSKHLHQLGRLSSKHHVELSRLNLDFQQLGTAS